MSTTTLNPQQVALRFYNAVKDYFVQLYYRWEDEQEYEDIREYGEAIIKNFPDAEITDLAMTGQPFAATFKASGVAYCISLKTVGKHKLMLDLSRV